MAAIIKQNWACQPIAEPIGLDRRRRRLAPLIKRHCPKDRPYIVSLHRRGNILKPEDHTVVLRRDWSRKMVGPEDIVIITSLPLGGGGGGDFKQIGGAVAMIALALAAPFVIGSLGIAALGTVGSLTFLGQAAAAGLVVAGGYVISLATQPKANSNDTRPVYGVAGGTNTARPLERVPSHFGRVVTKPDLAQRDYTNYDGDDQILWKRMTLGVGNYDIENVKVAGVPFWIKGSGIQPPFNAAPGGGDSGQFGDQSNPSQPGSGTLSAIEFIPPGGTSTLVPSDVYSAAVSGELPRPSDPGGAETPAYAVCPVGQTTKLIQIDYSIPGGVYHQAQTHPGTDSYTYSGKWVYAPCDDDNVPTGPFIDLLVASETLNVQRDVRRTRKIEVPEGRYVAKAANLKDDLEDNSNHDAIQWDGLRSFLGITPVRPDTFDIAMVVRSGKALGITTFGDVTVEATRILRVWDEATNAWVNAPTRKCVYAFLSVMSEWYGGNIEDSELDIERVKYYADTLTEFDTFDGTINGPVSVLEAASAVLGPMRSEPTRIGNTWSFRRDEQQAVKKHVVTRRQIKRDSTVGSWKISLLDGSADVLATYSPGGDPSRSGEVRYTLGAQTNNPRRVHLLGVSDARHATHLAKWISAVAFFRRKRRKLTTAYQGRNMRRGDPMFVDAWFMSKGAKAAGVMEAAGNVLTLDTDVEITSGIDVFALFRDRKGRAWGPVAVTQGAALNRIVLDPDDVEVAEENAEITLANMLAADNQSPTSVLIGTFPSEEWLLDVIQPQNKQDINLEVLNDHPGVWETLGEAIPEPPPLPSQVGNDNDPSVINLKWIKASCQQKGAGLTMDWSLKPERGAASYVVKISYGDGVWEPVSDGLVSSGSFPIRYTEDSISVGAYAISQAGLPGLPVYDSFSVFKVQLAGDTAIIDGDTLTPESIAEAALADAAASARVIADQAIEETKFASNIAPPIIYLTEPDASTYTGSPIIVVDGVLKRLVDDGSGPEWGPIADEVPAEGIIGEIVADQIAAGAVTASKLAAEAVTLTAFASGLRPVEVVTSLPSSDNTEGRTVYLTTDDKLYRYTGSGWTKAVDGGDIDTGTVIGTKLADGAVIASKLAAQAVTLTSFASGLRPVEVVTSLPGSDNTEGRTVYLTTDDKLYRYTGSAWTKAVDGGDIDAGTVIAAKLADGAVTAVKLAAQAVTLTAFATGLRPVEVVATLPSTGNVAGRTVVLTSDGKLYRWDTSLNGGLGGWTAKTAAVDITGTLTNDQIAALDAAKLTGQITTTKIADGAISTPKIAAGAVVTASLAANSITASKVVIGSSSASLIQNGGFEDGLTGWTFSTTGGGSSSLITGASQEGVNCLRLISGAAATAVAYTGNVPVEGGQGYQFAAWMYSVSGKNITFGVNWYDRTMGGISTQNAVSQTSSVNNSWTEYSGQLVAPANAAIAQFYIGTTSVGTTMYFDGVRVKRTVGTTIIEDDAITTGKIAAGAVTANEIAANTITAGEIAAGAIGTTQLAAGAVTAGIIAAGAITTAKLAVGSVDATIIADGAVTTAKIFAGAVTTNELAAGAVTAAKIAANTITAGQIAAGAISTTELASGAVTTGILAAGAITTAKLAIGSVDATIIADGAVTTSKIFAGAVTTNELAAGAVTAAKIAANTITAGQIQAGAISTTELAAGAVTTPILAAGAVVASKLAVSSALSNLCANGEFEEDATGFNATWNYGSSIGATISTSEFHSGAQSCRIDKGTVPGTGVGRIYGRAFPMAGNEKLEVAVWIKASAATSNGIYIGMECRNAAGTSVLFLYSRSNGSAGTSWEYVTAQVTTHADTVLCLPLINNYTQSAAQYLYVDDFSIRRTGGTTFIQDGAITTAKIVAGAVTANEIAAATITGAKIAANTISASNMVANTLTAATIAAGAIGTTQLAAGAVTTNILAAGAVVASKLAVTSYAFNLVPNGDFDEGSIDGWGITSVAGSPTPTIGLTNTSNSKSGAYVMNLDRKTAASGTAAVTAGSGFFPVEKDTIYEAGAWIYASGSSSAGCSVGILWYDSSKTFISADYALNNGPIVTAVWTERRGSLPAAPSTARYGRAFVSHTASSTVQVMYADNVSVRKQVGTTLIADGAITSDKIVAGAIVAGKIAAGAINAANIIVDNLVVTGHIVAESVGYLRSASGGSVTVPPTDGSVDTYVTLCTMSVTVVRGPSLMLGFIEFDVEDTHDTTTYKGFVDIVVDGSASTSKRVPHMMVPFGSVRHVRLIDVMVINYQQTLSAGSHTIALRLRNPPTNVSFTPIPSPTSSFLTFQELRA